MSVRLLVLTPSPNSALSRRAGSGRRAKRPYSAASRSGVVLLNWSLWPSGMTSSLISGLPRRLTWTSRPTARVRPRERSTEIWWRSVVDHTPTTALADEGPDTARWFRVTCPSGTCSTTVWVL